MKYTLELIIDLQREAVLEKFDSIENMKHWQQGFVSYEHLTGTPGQEGAISKLHYIMGKREIEMKETILKRNIPEEFHATYDTKGVHNIQKNYFAETEDGKTKWTTVSEFHFSGFFMKLIGALMPSAFKKQSKKYMEDFKNFAEKGVSVQENAT